MNSVHNFLFDNEKSPVVKQSVLMYLGKAYFQLWFFDVLKLLRESWNSINKHNAAVSTLYINHNVMLHFLV